MVTSECESLRHTKSSAKCGGGLEHKGAAGTKFPYNERFSPSAILELSSLTNVLEEATQTALSSQPRHEKARLKPLSSTRLSTSLVLTYCGRGEPVVYFAHART